MEFDLDKVWQGVLAGMKLTVSEATFKAYIKQTTLLAAAESAARLICEVGCPSAYAKATLEQRYWGQLAAELKRVTGKTCELRFVIQSKKATETEADTGLPLFAPQVEDERWRTAGLRADFTFANYAVGGSNQMAYAAATAVAKKLGQAYNPLFIYGGVGVGKTHLMQAVGHAVLGSGGDSVLFRSGEEFTNDLVEGIKSKTTDKVRAKYRKVKLLLIDDVQFIAGKASVQEDFFHTFNSLQGAGGQIVMTSDKPPAEIAKLEERLRSRFGAGLIVDIGPADFELRTAILLIKAGQRQVDLPMDVAQLVAAHVAGVRELEGFLVKLTTEMEQGPQPATLELAQRLLKITPAESDQRQIVTPAEVISLVGSFYGVGIQQLKGERRSKPIVWPRQILMYLLRTELRLPYAEVGRLVGGRDHTTVLHATDKVTHALGQNASLQHQLAQIKKRLFTPSG